MEDVGWPVVWALLGAFLSVVLQKIYSVTFEAVPRFRITNSIFHDMQGMGVGLEIENIGSEPVIDLELVLQSRGGGTLRIFQADDEDPLHPCQKRNFKLYLQYSDEAKEHKVKSALKSTLGDRIQDESAFTAVLDFVLQMKNSEKEFLRTADIGRGIGGALVRSLKLEGSCSHMTLSEERLARYKSGPALLEFLKMRTRKERSIDYEVSPEGITDRRTG